MVGKLKLNKTDMPSVKKILQMLGLLSILGLVGVPNLFADSLDSAVIGMFPKDASDMGYADLTQARQLPWYPQFEAQLVPVAFFGFEQFLEAIQMRQTSPINQVAWATVSADTAISDHVTSGRAAPQNRQSVAVAIGEFDLDSIKSYLVSKNISSIQVGNYTLYASGTGSGSSDVFFTLLDSKTIAFGSFRPLKRVLAIRDGEEDSLLQNEAMMTMIERANGDNIFWGVMNSTVAAHTIERLIPEAAKFSQSRDLLQKLKEVVVTVKVPGDIELDVQAAPVSSGDAVLLSQLLQAGVLTRRYQANNEDNPEMAKLLDSLSIGANGNLLDITVDLTNDELISLIEHNAFSMKM
jgi:hypothetical protein